MIRLFSAFVFALLILGLAAPAATAQLARLEGTVREAATSRPIPGANVVYEQLGTEVSGGAATDAEGQFHLNGLAPGRYRLTVTAVGYEAAARTVQLAAGAARTLAFELAASTLELDEVAVSVTRGREPLQDVPASVSLLTPRDLDVQRGVTADLGAVLAQQVPGLAPSSGTLSNYGQTLRGRGTSVLIDGVPQTTPLRNASRWLRTIDPSAIERVEVVRGASALYGYGATGGTINIVTKEPAAGGPRFYTEIESSGSPADVGESLSGRFKQQVSGQSGRIDYLASGTYARRGYFYDGEGDLIPQDPQGQGGLGGTTEYNALVKGGYRLTPTQRLQASVNYYRIMQDLEYLTTPGTAEAGSDALPKTVAVRSDSIPGKDTGTENLVAWLGYSHADVVGSALSARLYMQDYMTRFGFFEGHPDGGGQGYVDTRKYGLRTDLTTPVAALPDGRLLWGVDLLYDQTAQPLVDGRTYVPEMVQKSAAAFAQFKARPVPRLLLRAGLRYEAIRLDVDDYTALYVPESIGGGTLTYDALLPSVGTVVTMADGWDAFASYSQGYSVADVGRVLRSPQEGFTSVEQLSPEAMKVSSYEVGARLSRARFDAEVAGFLSTSDLGATFGDLPELQIVRSPERVYGVEASAGLRLFDGRLRTGGTFTWLEGKRDATGNGSYDTYLSGDRIPPLKLTAYVGGTLRPGWDARLQMLHTGSRDRFPESTAFAEGAVEAVTTFDLLTTLEAGPGTVRLAAENLFDTFYYPTVAQWYNSGGLAHTAAPGRQIRLGYALTW